MSTSSVTSKGQVTLPSLYRKQLKIKPSDRVVFKKEGSRLYVEKVESIDSLFGSLANRKVKPLSIKKMNNIVDKGMFSDEKE